MSLLIQETELSLKKKKTKTKTEELIKISVSVITSNICLVPWGPLLSLVCLDFQRFPSAPAF